jgi:tetratricopeptide (TPR) repeat protein
MEHKTKQDMILLHMVSDFESKLESGAIGYLDDKHIIQLIQYYENENDLDKAIELVNIAIVQYQYRVEFYTLKARLLLKEGNIEQCLSLLENASNLVPNEKEILILKAKAFASMKLFDKALDLINDLKTASLDSEHVEALLAEAFVLEMTKDYTGMYDSLKSALYMDPLNEEALEKIWNAVELSRNFKNSIEFHKKLIDEHPYNQLSWYNLGLSYSCIWEYDMAIEALEYAFIIDPDLEKAYHDCAELCIQQSQNDKALKILKEANERFGPDPDILVNMALCCIRLKDFEQGKSILYQALKLDTYNEEIYYYLGECYLNTGYGFSAINAYQKAIELDDEREEYYLALAKAYVLMEDFNRATVNFHKAASICMEDSLYWCEYASFIIKIGLYKEALEVLDEAEEYAYGADLLYCRAVVLYFLDQKNACISLLEEALEEDFELHKILYQMAPEMELDKKINALIRYYEKEYEF